MYDVCIFEMVVSKNYGQSSVVGLNSVMAGVDRVAHNITCMWYNEDKETMVAILCLYVGSNDDCMSLVLPGTVMKIAALPFRRE